LAFIILTQSTINDIFNIEYIACLNVLGVICWDICANKKGVLPISITVDNDVNIDIARILCLNNNIHNI
jgi:hypothetical protein